jgi:ornithine carrier protein
MDSEYKTGFIAGITRAIVSQPFDTIKTKMQSSLYKNSYECLKMTIKNEGLFFLYKGMTFPLIGNSFVVGTYFHVYNKMNQNKYNPFISGSIAGICSSFISNPIEFVRIKMQMTDKMANNTNYKNSFICMKNIIKYDGFSGIFKGQLATSLRDSIGYALFFGVYANYDNYKYYFDTYYKNNELLHKFTKGILCGMALWGISYPIDVVKTNIQSCLLSKKYSYLQCIHDIHSKYKIKGFYRGLNITLIRAIPVNIAIVLTIDAFKTK